MVQNGASPQSAPADAADPLVGRVLNDKFRIVEVLGAGGMGRVYKAVQSPLERLVALKVLNPQYSEGKDPGFQKRFFMEAAVTSKLRHPNTVTIFDYGKTDDGVLYIAMEYLEGQTLANLLANARTAAGPAGRVEVAIGRGDGAWWLDVVDSGPGVPAADTERIFERLVRLDTARTRGPGRRTPPGGPGPPGGPRGLSGPV